MSPRLELHFLGPPQLYLDNTPVTADRRKAVALLAYLAVESVKYTRDSLSALLWPDYDQSRAFTNLRHTLWEISQSIGEGWLIADRETIGLNEAAPISLDIRDFESRLAEGSSRADVDKIIAACIKKMGEVVFSDSYDEGQKMTMDESLVYALNEY